MIDVAVLEGVANFFADGRPARLAQDADRVAQGGKRSANRAIWVILPLPSVPSNVINNPRILKPLQTRSLGRVFDDPSCAFQLIAQGVGALEIFCLARGIALFQQAPAIPRGARQSRSVFKAQNRTIFCHAASPAAACSGRIPAGSGEPVIVAHPFENSAQAAETLKSSSSAAVNFCSR